MQFHLFRCNSLLNAGLAFMFLGCARAADSPRAAFDAFHSSLDSNDIEQFRSLVTPDTVSAAAAARKSGKAGVDLLEVLLERYRAVRPYRVTEISIKGNEAEISVEWRDPFDGKLKVGTFTLIKLSSSWKIDLSADVQAWVDALDFIKQTSDRMQESADGFFPECAQDR